LQKSWWKADEHDRLSGVWFAIRNAHTACRY
jgi:hypothetical protein